MKRDRNSKRPSRNNAFTLIEIMMVVAIVGLTLTMGMPAFLHMLKRDGMRKMEYDLLEACKDARRAAIMDNKTVELVFHPAEHTFEVPGAFPPDTIPDGIIIDVLGVNFINMESADVAQVHFFPNGTSDEFTILLHSADEGYRKIYLDTVTALPQVEVVQ